MSCTAPIYADRIDPLVRQGGGFDDVAFWSALEKTGKSL
jgi:hypothetical protein